MENISFNEKMDKEEEQDGCMPYIGRIFFSHDKFMASFISMAINSPNPIIPNDERMNNQLLPGSKLRVTIEKGVRVATMRFIDANPCPIIGLSSNSLILSFHSASRDE